MKRLGAVREGEGEQTAGIRGWGVNVVEAGEGADFQRCKRSPEAASEARGGLMHAVSCRVSTGHRAPGHLCHRSRG